MAKKQPKPRPMKSRKNGLKWKKLIEENQKVLNALSLSVTQAITPLNHK
jgi:hypothetical protein